jgi:nucleoside-diphosphate-sugar epimerase
MMRVAVVGASGFIGTRLVEHYTLTAAAHSGEAVEVRAVARSLTSLVPLARFDLDYQVADALDERALQRAFVGCEVVVHAIAGSPRTIVDAVTPLYRAANDAGVRRVIYLSSAAVHGQAPSAGTDEHSPLSNHQSIAYNNAKVEAERMLLRLRQQGTTEVVILRPAIVFGPRSFWVVDFAERLLRGQGCWLDEGRGICNTLYVDNLVHAIDLALRAPAIDGEAFLLGDAEVVTWADLYLAIAHALGMGRAEIEEAKIQEPQTFLPRPRENRPSVAQRLHSLRSAAPIQGLLGHVPDHVRGALYTLVFGRGAGAASPWSLPAPVRPVLSEEMTLLYRCHYKLPYAKATERLHYAPLVSFAEGCRRTVAWLAFAGYPVVEKAMASEDGGSAPR